MALSIADTGFIMLGLSNLFLSQYASIQLEILLNCNWYHFLFIFVSHLSSWILVIMTTERCIAIYFPLHAKCLCTSFRAKVCVACLALILGTINSVHLVVVTPRIGYTFHCGTVNYKSFGYIWPWIDTETQV